MAEGIRNQYGFEQGEEHYMLIIDKVLNHAYNKEKDTLNYYIKTDE